MSLMKKLFLAAAFFMAVGTAAQAFAQEQESYPVWDSIIRKLGRGVGSAIL